jgi:hypothetical protein
MPLRSSCTPMPDHPRLLTEKPQLVRGIHILTR